MYLIYIAMHWARRARTAGHEANSTLAPAKVGWLRRSWGLGCPCEWMPPAVRILSNRCSNQTPLVPRERIHPRGSWHWSRDISLDSGGHHTRAAGLGLDPLPNCILTSIRRAHGAPTRSRNGSFWPRGRSVPIDCIGQRYLTTC